MVAAKVVSLTVRPLQVSHLCFEVGGVLGELGTQLGAPAVAFDFATFYSLLPNTGGDPSRLSYDAKANSALSPSGHAVDPARHVAGGGREGCLEQGNQRAAECVLCEIWQRTGHHFSNEPELFSVGP